ncbi:voltage-gated potassium channel [Friedmanniella endophytica]|uniref:Voltage-gated potassium channel n=1 Tax=Microlunatus kandeliicorticis TaxID=1759536 RepID=A0A7W3P5G4_9ACTN|nr:potassium channel family protein [Microlunatus kandeliicorticis]MBA8793951.1 voltage-gated potassium channel [Microlunatus kandeliicorticis]
MTLATWQRRAELPLAIAAVVFLISYSWTVLVPDLPRELRFALELVDYATWLVFTVDYVGRVVLAERRWSYVRHHLVDLLIVVLPLLRPLRVLRLITLLRFIERRVAHSLQGRVAVYVALSTALVLYTGSLAELEAERHAHGSNIHTFGTSLWWAITTITTVGYGDHYPVTTQGRLVAAALMIAGVALLGVVTASLASWLVQRVRLGAETASQDERPGEVERLRAELAELRARFGTDHS